MWISNKAWTNFINALGVEELVKNIEKLKRELHRRLRRKGKDFKWYINSIRLEHLG